MPRLVMWKLLFPRKILCGTTCVHAYKCEVIIERYHTLMRQQGFWHKACRLKFNQTKLDQLNKKVALVEDTLSMQTCSIQSKVELKDALCLFL